MRRPLLAVVALFAALSLGAHQIGPHGPPRVALSGFIDPTAATFNSSHPMQTCTTSCSSTLINQNTDALQAAITTACSTHATIRGSIVGNFPIFRGSGAHNQSYGELINACAGLVIDWPGAVFDTYGNCGQSDFYTFQITGSSSNLRFFNFTLSAADATNCSEHTHGFEVGSGAGTNLIDDVQWVGLHCINQGAKGASNTGGDCINLLGGYDSSHLDQRLYIGANYFNSRRSSVGFQHGTGALDIVGNFFNQNADQSIDHEPTSPGGNVDENIVGNFLYQPTSTGTSLSMSGSGPDLAQQNVVAGNLIWGGVNAVDLARTWFDGNMIFAKQVDTATPEIYLLRRGNDVWITDNYIYRGPTAVPGSVITDTANNGLGPVGVWVRGNQVDQYSGGGFTLTCVANTLLSDGETVSISDGVLSKVYEFDKVPNGCTVGHVCVDVSAASTATLVCNDLETAISANQPSFTVYDEIGAFNTAGGQGLTTISDTVANVGFITAVLADFSGVELDGVRDFWVTDNRLRYHGVSPNSGAAVGFIGVFARSQTQIVSGLITGNWITRDLQADGVTTAGKLLAGIDFSTDTFTQIGHGAIRDNYVTGAQDAYFMTQVSTLTEGIPVVTGNVLVSVTAENLPAKYRLDATGGSESVASGALSPSRLVSVMPTSGTSTHTLAACTWPGETKQLKWTTVSGTDTTTITSFGDGTSLSTSTANTYAVLGCDGTSWWLLDKSSTVTVNP